MFVLFTPRHRRLHVTLAETRRIAGKVRRRHIVSVGSVAIDAGPASEVYDRVRLWQALHSTLAALQLDPEASGRIMSAVHARLPMPTPEETEGVERFEAEQRLERLEGSARNTARLIELHERSIARHQADVAELKIDAAREAELVDDAKAKVARLANYPRPG